MNKLEAFRVCLLPVNHGLHPAELARRQTHYEHALRRLLDPLKFGHRLEFMSVFRIDGLWQVATIASSGQTVIDTDIRPAELLDQELRREATVAGNLVGETFRILNQLISQKTFTPAEFERLYKARFEHLDVDQVRPLIRAAHRDGAPMQVVTLDGTYSLFDLGRVPSVVADTALTIINLRVIGIALKSAVVKPHRHSARSLGIRARSIDMSFESGLTCNSFAGRRLFKSLRHGEFISCSVHVVRNISGEFEPVRNFVCEA